MLDMTPIITISSPLTQLVIRASGRERHGCSIPVHAPLGYPWGGARSYLVSSALSVSIFSIFTLVLLCSQYSRVNGCTVFSSISCPRCYQCGQPGITSGLYQGQTSIAPGTLLLIFKTWHLMDTLWQVSVTWNISIYSSLRTLLPWENGKWAVSLSTSL